MDAKPRWVLRALLNAKLPLNIFLDEMAMVVLAEAVRDMVVVHGVVAVIMSLIVLMRIWS